MRSLLKCWVIFLSVFLAAAVASTSKGNDLPQARDSLDKRVKRLEKKTDFYKIGKLKKTAKFVRRERSKSAQDGGINCNSIYDGDTNYDSCEYFLQIESQFPISSLVKFELTIGYASTISAEIQVIIGTAPSDNPTSKNSIVCPYILKILESDENGQFQYSFACQMIVNSQNGDGIGVEVSIRAEGPEGSFLLKDAAIEMTLINEVITDFGD